MKTLARMLLWFFGTAIFLLVTACFTLSYLLNKPEFIDAATGYMERTVKRTVTVDRLDYTVFPFSLVAHEVTLKEKYGIHDFVHIQTLAIGVNFKTLDIPFIRVDSPVVHILQRDDGTFNFSDLVPVKVPQGDGEASRPDDASPIPAPTPEATPLPEKAPPMLTIHKIEVVNGRVEGALKNSAGEPQAISLAGLNAQLETPLDFPFSLASATLEAKATFQSGSFGAFEFDQGSVAAALSDGMLTLSHGQLSVWSGFVEGRGSIHLTARPPTYKIEGLRMEQIHVGPLLTVCGSESLGDITTGELSAQASASGTLTRSPIFHTMSGFAQARIKDLQTIGKGGTPMDQLWGQLDQPLLLTLLPHLQTQVKQSKKAIANTTTTRYETVTSRVVLREGIATVSDTHMGLPDYQLSLDGNLNLAEDQMDLTGKIVASARISNEISNGKKRDDLLLYENDGLLLPFMIRGTLNHPTLRLDTDAFLKNALEAPSVSEALTSESPASELVAPLLDSLSTSDRKNVEKGLKKIDKFLKK